MKVQKKKQENRPIFAIKFDPRLPALHPLVEIHYRAMVSQDKYLKECFTKPPLIAFRRQSNIRNFLIKSKVAPPTKPYPRREKIGMNKCTKSCSACPYIQEGKYIKVDNTKTWKISRNMSCESFNIIYLLECNKCLQRYVGTTGRQLKHRVAEHRGYINNQVLSKATGSHFNLPGHSLANFKVTILEQTKSKDTLYRLEREKYFIRILNTFNNGMNREW